MERECGNPNYPIWLLGDSEPQNWSSKLKTPFDMRHPIRHNIWTSIIDLVQDRVFRELRERIDTSRLYIRNAIGERSAKPDGNDIQWRSEVCSQIDYLTRNISEYKPIIVFTFGAFSYEFGRRATGDTPNKAYGYWGTRRLGDEFRTRIGEFKMERPNLIPLLHRSISGGKFLESHEYFSGMVEGNYFEYVAEHIAKIIIERKNRFDIWI